MKGWLEAAAVVFNSGDVYIKIGHSRAVRAAAITSEAHMQVNWCSC